VEIFVDGTSIGTTTANGDGDFSFTPTTPLAAGLHDAFPGATDAAGNDSPQSNTNGFLIDTDDPAAPRITTPGQAGKGANMDESHPRAGASRPDPLGLIGLDSRTRVVRAAVCDSNAEIASWHAGGMYGLGAGAQIYRV
jgi:hypothetical protein